MSIKDRRVQIGFAVFLIAAVVVIIVAASSGGGGGGQSGAGGLTDSSTCQDLNHASDASMRAYLASRPDLAGVSPTSFIYACSSAEITSAEQGAGPNATLGQVTVP